MIRLPILLERPDLCVCNHGKNMHEHYTGTWCSKCPPPVLASDRPECNRYRRMIFLLVRRRSGSVD